MLSITIPLWLMLTTAGVPTLLLALLVIRLLRVKHRRKPQRSTQPVPSQQDKFINHFSGQMHHEIMEQQIDAVFNALATVLETERIKLKALVTHALPAMALPTKPIITSIQSPAVRLSADYEPVQPAETTIAQQIAGMVKDGMSSEEIAKHLGISQAEITLAMKMNAGRVGETGGKLRAIA
ncbi:MAG: hypothetical protein M0036_07790 [Desulfobacteraceae bacterium]|nr:hypothetical protein [Desulfobacteraceae bacterium]